MGISYKIKNPPYDTVTLVPYVEEDNKSKSPFGGPKKVKSNVVFSGKRRIIWFLTIKSIIFLKRNVWENHKFNVIIRVNGQFS